MLDLQKYMFQNQKYYILKIYEEGRTRNLRLKTKMITKIMKIFAHC